MCCRTKVTAPRRRSCTNTPPTAGAASLESSILVRFGRWRTWPSVWTMMATTQKPKSYTGKPSRSRIVSSDRNIPTICSRSRVWVSLCSTKAATPTPNRLDRETLEAERRVFGPEHRETLITTGYLADALVRENRYSDAETLRVQVLAISRRVFGPESPDTLAAMESLGVTLSYEKQYAKAENLFQE